MDEQSKEAQRRLRISRGGGGKHRKGIRHLETSGIMHHILKDLDSNRLKGLFITCPESVQYLQYHHDVILIDNTYSTNRFDMPLMDIIGWFSLLFT